MKTKVLNHFKKNDPKLYTAIRAFKGNLRDGPQVQKDLFASLCRTIVGQQLSGNAANSIWRKFSSLFPRKKPRPCNIITCNDVTLRESGLSFAKIRSIRDLSERISNRSLKLPSLRKKTSEEAREALQEVIGIGPWSSEIFLMFSLGHEDMFPLGDLGLQKGIQKIYKLRTLPDKKKIESLSKKWSPYRTYAACAIWSILDNQ